MKHLITALIFVLLLGNSVAASSSYFAGTFRSDQSRFQRTFGSQTEFSALKKIGAYRWLSLEFGLTFWNQHKRFNGIRYQMDSLFLPLRLKLEVPAHLYVRPYVGAALGTQFAIENFNRTEVYTALGQSYFIGIRIPSWKVPYPDILIEYAYTYASFTRLSDFEIMGPSIRVGFIL